MEAAHLNLCAWWMRDGDWGIEYAYRDEVNEEGMSVCLALLAARKAAHFPSLTSRCLLALAPSRAAGRFRGEEENGRSWPALTGVAVTLFVVLAMSS